MPRCQWQALYGWMCISQSPPWQCYAEAQFAAHMIAWSIRHSRAQHGGDQYYIRTNNSRQGRWQIMKIVIITMPQCAQRQLTSTLLWSASPEYTMVTISSGPMKNIIIHIQSQQYKQTTTEETTDDGTGSGQHNRNRKPSNKTVPCYWSEWCRAHHQGRVKWGRDKGHQEWEPVLGWGSMPSIILASTHVTSRKLKRFAIKWKWRY